MELSNRPVGRLWRDYLLTALFVTPPLIAFALVTVFIAPKMKQMCVDAGFDGSPYFRPLDFVSDRAFVLLVGAVLLICFLEMALPLWRRHRPFLLGTAVFVVNCLVLAALLSTLLVSGVVGPALSAKRASTASVQR